MPDVATKCDHLWVPGVSPSRRTILYSCARCGVRREFDPAATEWSPLIECDIQPDWWGDMDVTGTVRP